MSAADRRSAGSSVARRPKIIELTVAVPAPSTTASSASAPTDATSGMRRRTVPAPARAATSTGRKPIRSPSTPPSGETSAPTRAAVPITSPIAEARPGPTPVMPSTRTGMYGRLIWMATNEMPKIRKIRRVGPSVRTPRSEANARSTIRPSGTTSGRTSFEPNVTSSAVPTDSSAEKAKTGGKAQPNPSIRTPARTGPTANPIGPDAPKIAIVVPRRARGVTSRMPASMIPVLPSWNPISSIASATCHGSRASATAANTTASTRALRTMTALRLYLSAHAPHNGTSGMPTTKISALNSPMKARRSASATPISRR